MTDPIDIRYFVRDDRYLGVTYRLVLWNDGGKSMLSEIYVDGASRIEEDDKRPFANVDEAFAHGEARAKDFINASDDCAPAAES